MKAVNLRVPLLIFAYAAIFLAAVFCILTLYMENAAMQQDLLEWQQRTHELNQELDRINRYSSKYGATPEITAAVFRESERHNLDPGVMFELIKLESDFDARAISSHDAHGLCQIRPITARELSQELNIPYSDELLFNTDYNIMLGSYYLSKLLHSYGYDYHHALTAYNRGPAGLKKYLNRTGTAVSSYSARIFEGSLAAVIQ
ncbi:MAG: transglycosylase SLT domain-containing protein [Clostridia bacterium]|jgi:soluble lytic murein transglycosylase-like protein|nr:transglycosylase SLT domain-containing protein [Clostridia bacterium]